MRLRIALLRAVLPLLLAAAPGSLRAATPTSTTLTPSQSSLASGTALTLTAAVSAAGAPVTRGTVLLCDAPGRSCTDIHRLGTAQLTSAGTAVFRLVPKPGTSTFAALFTGTTSNAASTSTAVTVTTTAQLTPTVTLASQPDSTTTTAYDLAATVSASGVSTPIGGTISFLDTTSSSAVLATAPLVPVAPQSAIVLADRTDSSAGQNPLAIATGDFNQDGIPDLAVANTSSLTVLLGTATGAYVTSTINLPSTNGCYSLVAADLNNDGHIDLAVSCSTPGVSVSGSISVLLGAGDGSFTAAGSQPTGRNPYALIADDFDQDGNLDLAVAAYNDQTITVLFGAGNGTFTAAAPILTTSTPNSLVSADLNGDSVPDLVAVENPYATAQGGTGVVQVFLNRGGRAAPSAATLTLPFSTDPLAAVAADLQNRGRVDLVVSDRGGHGAAILSGNGDGTFTPNRASTVGAGAVTALAAVDLNQDHYPDIAAIAGSNLSIALNGRTGLFASNIEETVTSSIAAFVPGSFHDLDTTDFAVVTPSSNLVHVFQSTWFTSATAAVQDVLVAGTGTHNLAASFPGSDLLAPASSAPLALDTNAVPAPTFTPPLGILLSSRMVTIADALPAAVIHYTTDGSIPNANSPTYTGPLSFTSNATLQAIAVAAGYQNSPVTSATYTVLGLTCSLASPTITAATNPAQVTASTQLDCSDPSGGTPTNLTINWGDGTTDTAVNHALAVHTYTLPSASLTLLLVGGAQESVSGVLSAGTVAISTLQQVTLLPGASAAVGSPTAVSLTLPPVRVPQQATFTCTSVSTVNGGQVVSSLPSQYGISCAVPTGVVSSTTSATPVTITVNTSSGSATARLVAPVSAAPQGVALGLVLPFSGLPLVSFGGLLAGWSRRRRVTLGLATLLLSSGAISSCGSGGKATANPVSPGPAATPAGTYLLTVTEQLTTTNPATNATVTIVLPLTVTAR